MVISLLSCESRLSVEEPSSSLPLAASEAPSEDLRYGSCPCRVDPHPYTAPLLQKLSNFAHMLLNLAMPCFHPDPFLKTSRAASKGAGSGRCAI